MELEVGEAAVARLGGPLADAAELMKFLVLVEDRGRAFHGRRQPAEADVVRASLGEHGGELDRHDRVQERDVLVDQLFLQADRVRADDDAALVVFFARAAFLPGLPVGGREDGGNEIRKALADSRAGFHDEMPALSDRPADGLGHLQLLGARFVPGQSRGNEPALAEHPFHRQSHDCSRCTPTRHVSSRESLPSVNFSTSSTMASMSCSTVPLDFLMRASSRSRP